MNRLIAILTVSVLLAGSLVVMAAVEASENSETHTDPDKINEPVKTWVLLSSESPEWRKSAGQFAPDPSKSERNRMVIIPQQFLIQGDILWIGLGGPVPKEQSIYATGLMKLDLATGRVLSCRYGKVKGDMYATGPVLGDQHIDRDSTYHKSLLPIFNWHDCIVVGQIGAGIFLYPAQVASAIADLSNVTIINVDTGLPSNQLVSIAALDDRLFIMTAPGTVRFQKDGKWVTRTGGEGWILSEWHQKTRTIKIIADSQKQIGGMELQDNIEGKPKMTADPTNACLNFKFTLVRKNPDGIMAHAGQALYTYDPSAGKWHPAETNALTMLKPDTESAHRVAPEDYVETYNVQNYKNGTLAITGYGQHWKLVFFYRDGDETTKRWADCKSKL